MYDDFTRFAEEATVQMLDAQPMLDKFLDPGDGETLGRGVCAGFISCFELMEKTPALGQFVTGIPQWSYLVRTFVEHSLTLVTIKGMHYEFKMNEAHNCWHARYYKNGAAWTAHFVGGGENKRSIARRAECRIELAKRGLPLFPELERKPDLDTKSCYFQILFAGYKKVPESITVVIPTHDQLDIYAGCSLPIVQPSKVQVEQVKEEMEFKLRLPKIGDEDAGQQNQAG